MSNSKPNAKIKRAAGILLMTRSLPKQFLLLRHPDRWDLPKGHAETGETLTQTALRETEEETGIPADAIRLDPIFEFRLRYPVTYKRQGDTVFQKEVIYYLATIESPIKPTLTEHTAFEWFNWDPPHNIQEQTIDPLLAAVATHLS